ncbi:PucR family transcriptional regulator [Oceanobacillus massiliensis]|uniref:PucR family transcriptional regulator n=1 Tax=Oceanobacillus massiliensis TaxID=1465765 RepID=UPI000287EAA2|nr:helix-turn-helix domain-containing protein [Oceanobacillus massiliensis]
MQNTLKKLFSTFLIFDELEEIPDNYQWYLTDSNQIIGIHKDELGEKDSAILSAFLLPYDLNIPKPTKLERIWKKRITAPAPEQAEMTGQAFRFIYFHFKKDQIEPSIFKETIKEFYSSPAAVMWESEHEGIIIEQQDSQLEEHISYEQISDTLMSDLYVKIKFFEGPFLHDYTNLTDHYTSIIESARSAFNYTEKSAVSYVDAIPFELIDEISPTKRKRITQLILKDFMDDEDFLQTIRTFIQCNLNVSVTAKKLYMHRNSLQYRIDKFHEKTGIDVRQFEQAVTVYLALLSNMHKG